MIAALGRTGSFINFLLIPHNFKGLLFVLTRFLVLPAWNCFRTSCLRTWVIIKINILINCKVCVLDPIASCTVLLSLPQRAATFDSAAIGEGCRLDHHLWLLDHNSQGGQEDMAASANNGNPGELRKEWVRLNVGGRVFTTSRATLAKDPQSFLARIALEDTELGSDKVTLIIFLPIHTYIVST